jgi:SAM-dependent methyltransferase
MSNPLRRAACAAIASCFAFAAVPALAQKAAAAGQFEPQVGQSGKDVIWVPTPDEVVQKMLDMAQVAPGERLYDLGSGDGKIAIAAARRGARAKGIEYNPEMVEHSKRLARQANVEVELVQGDIFESNFTDADVITLYLLPHLNERLRPMLLAMKPGTRVTSHYFGMGDWEPDETATVGGREAHFWRVPAKIGGDWEVRIGNNAGPTLRIEQQFSKFEGKVDWANRAGPVRDAVLRGPVVAFTATDGAGVAHRFEGVADHTGPMMGVVTPVAGGAPKFFTATRR